MVERRPKREIANDWRKEETEALPYRHAETEEHGRSDQNLPSLAQRLRFPD